MEPRLIIPMRKGWSAAAREAALGARRAKKQAAQEPVPSVTPSVKQMTVGVKETTPGTWKVTTNGMVFGDSRGYSKDGAWAEAERQVARQKPYQHMVNENWELEDRPKSREPDHPHKFSDEAWRVVDGARMPIGGDFLRAGKNLGIEGAARIAAEIRQKMKDPPEGVFASHNAETGHGDYVRVNRGTNTFRFIAHLRS